MKKKVFLLLFIAAALPIFAIQQIRWGSSGDPLTGLTITWRNNGTADSIQWGYSSSFEMGAFIGNKRSGYSDYFFKYTFPVVNPSSTIHYQLYDSNTQSWGTAKTFNTAAATNTTNFSFCVLGDSRNGLSVWNQISNLAKAKNTDLSLFNGDMVDVGGSVSQWDNWFDSGANYLENNLVYHALGNHEASSVPTYQNNFELPKVNGSNLYYSFKYDNALFITLNSENPGDQGQATWLNTTLAAASADPDIVWKIISFHKPFYTIGSHAGEMNAYFNIWWKAFDDYGVDLIVNGHDHMYERTKPINRKISTTEPVSTYGSGIGQGRCQIVCGGAGAPLYSGTPTWAIEKYQSKYNFCVFTVNGSVLTGTVLDNNGNVIDDFSIDKTYNVSTGISENTNNVQSFNKIKVFPNPIENNFKLNYSSSFIGEATIKLFDMAGREILSENVAKDEEKLEYDGYLGTLAKGVYTIQIILGKQIDSQLIILK